jgi:regulatory protein
MSKMMETEKKTKEKKIIPEEVALGKLAALCSRAEQCTSYCRDKLSQWNVPLEAAERILAHLVREKYVDDRRYALFFAKDKHSLSKWGKKKIEQHLIRKKIPKAYIESPLREIPDEGYSHQLETLLLSKLKSTKGKNLFDLKAKLFRFAVGRGFEGNLALKTIDKILNEKKEELSCKMESSSDIDFEMYDIITE